jgi:hypothetical protein
MAETSSSFKVKQKDGTFKDFKFKVDTINVKLSDQYQGTQGLDNLEDFLKAEKEWTSSGNLNYEISDGTVIRLTITPAAKKLANCLYIFSEYNGHPMEVKQIPVNMVNYENKIIQLSYTIVDPITHAMTIFQYNLTWENDKNTLTVSDVRTAELKVIIESDGSKNLDFQVVEGKNNKAYRLRQLCLSR